MKKLSLFIFALVLAACNTSQQPQTADSSHQHAAAPAQSATQAKEPLPAFFKDAATLPKPLPPTLSPEKFSGADVKKAYQVAQEIPETLAQLPCFCYCDRAFGHKSLHSCYETDHSAGCSTCTDEALFAYQLQKEDGLSPAQVREQIITRFGR